MAAETPGERLRAYVEGVVGYADTHRAPMSALLQVVMSGAWGDGRPRARATSSHLERILADGQRSGEMRELRHPRHGRRRSSGPSRPCRSSWRPTPTSTARRTPPSWSSSSTARRGPIRDPAPTAPRHRRVDGALLPDATPRRQRVRRAGRRRRAVPGPGVRVAAPRQPAQRARGVLHGPALRELRDLPAPRRRAVPARQGRAGHRRRRPLVPRQPVVGRPAAGLPVRQADGRGPARLAGRLGGALGA